MPIQGPELSSSEDTGAHNARPVEWKSTADSAPNHKSASLSKESIVPQRSQAVHDQPTLDDAHDKGGVIFTSCFETIGVKNLFQNVIRHTCDPIQAHQDLLLLSSSSSSFVGLCIFEAYMG